VLAALHSPETTSVEGQVHRLKLVKREMYGPTSFDLLRLRVLNTAQIRPPQPARLSTHSLHQMSIACGYPNANDMARLGADPIHKTLLDRVPGTGLDLASQPTLSRFENSVGTRQLYRMGESPVTSVIERPAQRLRNRARLVTIDLDPTDDPTRGTQQLSLFRRTLRHLALPTGDGVCQLQRRGPNAISVCGYAAPGNAPSSCTDAGSITPDGQ